MPVRTDKKATCGEHEVIFRNCEDPDLGAMEWLIVEPFEFLYVFF